MQISTGKKSYMCHNTSGCNLQSTQSSKISIRPQVQLQQFGDILKFGADKPPIEELHQFLEFQLPRQWAPVYSDLALGPQRKRQSSTSLPVNIIGPKLYICTNMVWTASAIIIIDSFLSLFHFLYLFFLKKNLEYYFRCVFFSLR